MAPPPGLFSMTTGWPRRSDSFCPTIRAIRSLPPPGVNPTTMRIARDGYFAGSSCALALVAAKAASARQTLMAAYRREFFMRLKRCDLDMKHGRLAVVERHQTTVDRGRQFIRFG